MCPGLASSLVSEILKSIKIKQTPEKSPETSVQLSTINCLTMAMGQSLIVKELRTEHDQLV